MTELKVLQRKFIENNISLPRNNTFAGLQDSLTSLSSLGTFAAEKIAVERATQQGLTDAQANQGSPKRLAPGLTKATVAYNNAYNNMETNLISLTTMALMDDDLRSQSEPGKLNSTSVATYSEFAKARIEGALDGTSEQNKPDVGLRLSQHLMSSLGRMSDKVSAFNLQQLDNNFSFVLDKNVSSIYESSLGGDAEGIKMAANAIQDLVADRKALNLLSPAQEQAIWAQTSAALIDSQFTAGYLDSRVKGTSEQYLSDFATNKPDDITFDQWRSTASKLLSLKSQQDKLVSEQQTLKQVEWTQKLETGQIQSLQDIEPARSQMPAADFTQLQTRFIKSQHSQFSQQQKITEFLQLNVTNPSSAASMSADVKNDAYQQLINSGEARKRASTGDADVKLSLIEKADMVSVFNIPIPAFNDELSYALINGTPSQALQGALAYKRLAGESNRLDDLSAALSLDKTAEQIAVSALFQADFSTTELPAAIEVARKNILLSTDIERQARVRAYETTFGQTRVGVKNTKEIFKEIFDRDADKSPTAYLVMQRLLRLNAAEMPGLSEAKEMTKRQMAPVWGSSAHAKNKDEIMFFPPEKNVAFIENGRWFENQKILALHQITKNFSRQASADSSFTPSVMVKWDGPPIPDQLSEEKLLSESLLGTSTLSQSLKPPMATLNIDGKKREIYIDSDASTRNRNDGRLTYGFYYTDDLGFTQSVPDPFNSSGVAEWAILPFDSFLPQTSRQLMDKTIDQISEKEARALFDRDNPRRFILENLPLTGQPTRLSRTLKQKEFVESTAPEIAARLRSRRDSE